MIYEDFIYARISEDDAGTERNVSRQLRNCLEFSARHDGRVIAEFSDNDISALRGAHRPGYEGLVLAITAAGTGLRPRRIITQHTSRLWRNRTERATGIDILGKAGVTVKPIDGPELNLATAAGRMVAGMLGEVDTGESETKSERIVDAARERAFEGRGNGAVLYGWSRIYRYDVRGKVAGFDDVVHEAQAGIVREIVARLLSGDTLIGITNELNARGVPGPGAGRQRRNRSHEQNEDGSRWNKTSVRKLAIRPANIAKRVYHRGRHDEQLLPAAWPAIVDEVDHGRLEMLLTSPARSMEKPGSRQHLISWGIGRCGVCDGYLRVARRGNARWGSKQLAYVCDRAGCVGRNEASVDALIDEVMVRLLARDDAVALLDGDAGAAAAAAKRAAGLRLRQDKAAQDYAEGLIESAQLRIITERLRPQIAAAEAEAEANRENPFAGLAAAVVGEHARERWFALNVTQRRAVMHAFGMRVYIDRVARRGPGFDPATVRIVPRGTDG